MNSTRYQHVKQVFLAVCTRPAEEQDAAAAELSAGDSELLNEVLSLLVEHRRSAAPVAIAIGAVDPLLPVPLSNLDEQFPPNGARSAQLIRPLRFIPGTVIANRYRIVALVGSGGMGEVYRAEDLTLDQPIALKFLPEEYSHNPAGLERLRHELRLSRQVTHPNVCRVFDLGRVDDEAFITMEYVDGEDLAALLRRINRVSRDKALQISRQLCMALAAAHRCGVLHRDLKPANVMLDGHGNVRITDFGIAVNAEEVGGSLLCGTPAYMAPELFDEKQATIRSDIYALGLVMYEIFTGRPVFEARTPLEYKVLHETVAPVAPSRWRPSIDPLIEQAILRCMEKKPVNRPASALAVMAALSGGDALLAALEAGETPLPQIVAAAGDNAGLSPFVASCCLISTIVGLVIIVLLSRTAFMLPQAHLEKPPDVLVEKAREVLSSIGEADRAVDRAWGFSFDEGFARYVERYEPTKRQWERLGNVRPGAIQFWYRQSPEYLVSEDYLGIVTPDDPGRLPRETKTVWLDVLGRLKRLEVVPPRETPSGLTSAAIQQKANPTFLRAADFSILFEAAGLNTADFTADEPSSIPPVYADTRYAWSGAYPEAQHIPVRVEAATLAGTPVFFRIVEPWEKRVTALTGDSFSTAPGYITFQVALFVVLIAGSVLLIGWNLKGGLGDRRGARRVALFFGVLETVSSLLVAHHVPNLQLELQVLAHMLGSVLMHAVLVWMIYLALEPYVRRIWPETVISWSRILTGRIADALVGTHVLVGIVIGVAYMLLDQFKNLVPEWMGLAPALPRVDVKVKMLAFESPACTLLLTLAQAMAVSLLYLLLLVLLRLILRGKWLAGIAAVLIVAAVNVRWLSAGPLNWCFESAMAALLMFALVRFGLVTAIAAVFTAWSMWNQPITSNLSAWYGQGTIVEFVLVVGLAWTAWVLATKKWPTNPMFVSRPVTE